MKSKDFRLIDCSKEIEPNSTQILESEINGIKEKMKPKEYQAISVNGNIIINAQYHPDAIVTYKVPRHPIDYGIKTFPKHLQGEMKRLHKELNLTKTQIKEVKKTIKKIDLHTMEIDKQIKLINNLATSIKAESNKEQLVKKFYKYYSSFNECLTSELRALDSDIKIELKNELNNLIEIIEYVNTYYL